MTDISITIDDYPVIATIEDVGAKGDPGAPGIGVPVGGATGQVLGKLSDADHDTGWVDPAAGDGSGASGPVSWGSITGKPTTVAASGLTDAATTAQLTAEANARAAGDSATAQTASTALAAHVGALDPHPQYATDTALAGEAGARETTDTALLAQIVQETTNRQAADTAEAAARAAGDAARIPLAQRGAALGVATLDAQGLIPASQLPPLAISERFVVASQAAMLALVAQRGDVAIRTDLSRSYILGSDDPTQLANWSELLSPAAPVTTVHGRAGNVVAVAGDYTVEQITGAASQASLDAEATARAATDTTEATTRAAADTTLTNAVAAAQADATAALLDAASRVSATVARAANTFLRGPTSGAAAAPVWGGIVVADLPAHSSSHAVTDLAVGTVADGEYVRRVGSALVGGMPTATVGPATSADLGGVKIAGTPEDSASPIVFIRERVLRLARGGVPTPVGRYTDGTLRAAVTGTQALATGTLYAVPFMFDAIGTWDEIGALVAAAGTGVTFRTVLATAGADLLPSTVQMSSDELSAATAGQKGTVQTAVSFEAGRLYWALVLSSGVFTIRATSASGAALGGHGYASGDNNASFMLARAMSYGAIPSDVSGTWSYSSLSPIQVRVRRAS